LQPGKPFLLRLESLEVLGLFQNDSTIALFRNLIAKHDTLYIKASQQLIKWGDWETAAPVLAHFKLYNDLLNDPRGMPFVYSILDTGKSDQRVAAAKALYLRNHDLDSLHGAIRKVLALPSAQRGSVITKQAVDVLTSNARVQDVASIYAVLNSDTSLTTRLVAFSALVLLAYQDVPTALASLQDASEHCPDADIRDKAATYVRTVKKLEALKEDSLKTPTPAASGH
jgi:hypothetical protein